MRRLIAAAVLGGAACAVQAAGFTLSSPTIKPGSMLTDAQVFKGFGCAGKNISPALTWSGAPSGTKSYAVTVYDPDAPTGSGWWHWVVYNIPASTTELPEGAGGADGKGLPAGAAQGRTDFGAPGFGGACPPAGRQAAPLHLHRVRAQDGQDRRAGGRERRHGRLHDQRQQARQGELRGEVRAQQVS